MTLSRGVLYCPVARVRADIDCPLITAYCGSISAHGTDTVPMVPPAPAPPPVTRDTWTPTLLDISRVSVVDIYIYSIYSHHAHQTPHCPGGDNPPLLRLRQLDSGLVMTIIVTECLTNLIVPSLQPASPSPSQPSPPSASMASMPSSTPPQ